MGNASNDATKMVHLMWVVAVVVAHEVQMETNQHHQLPQQPSYGSLHYSRQSYFEALIRMVKEAQMNVAKMMDYNRNHWWEVVVDR